MPEIEHKYMLVCFKGETFENIPKIVKKHPLEYWNLKKMTFRQFILRTKAKIPPVNDSIARNNYNIRTRGMNNQVGITEEEYETLSWAILFPNYYDFNFFHFTTSIVLYNDLILRPQLISTQIGLQWLHIYEDYPNIYPWQEEILLDFIYSKFNLYYKKYYSLFKLSILDYSQVRNWSKEDWRLSMAYILFRDMDQSKEKKNVLTWQREFAEYSIILESLLTAESNVNTEIGYRLRKRFALLFKNKFPDCEANLKKVYKYRSQFVHGDLFTNLNHQARRESQDDSGITNLLMPNEFWELSANIRKYVRYLIFVYAAIYYEFIKDSRSYRNVIELLEECLLNDVEKRKVQKFVSEILSNIE